MRDDCTVSIAAIAFLLFVSGILCHAQQGGDEWLAERKRDWELNTLRSQASSLDSQRRMGVEQAIGDLEWKRKSHNFSENDFIQKNRMNWDVQRVEAEIRQKQDEQQREEQQLRTQEELDRQRRQAILLNQSSIASAASGRIQPNLNAPVQTTIRKPHEHFITQDEIEQARELRDKYNFRYQSESYWLNEIKRFNKTSEYDRQKIVEAADGTPLAFYFLLTPLARVGFRPDVLFQQDNL